MIFEKMLCYYSLFYANVVLKWVLPYYPMEHECWLKVETKRQWEAWLEEQAGSSQIQRKVRVLGGRCGKFMCRINWKYFFGDLFKSLLAAVVLHNQKISTVSCCGLCRIDDSVTTFFAWVQCIEVRLGTRGPGSIWSFVEHSWTGCHKVVF